MVVGLGGDPVRLIWLDCDPATLYARIVARASPNDAAKLADFDAYVARMRPGVPPAVAHLAIHNRGPIDTIERQVDAIVRASGAVTGRPHPASTAG